MKVLRDYQVLASESVIKSDCNPILCLPTGAGKTVIASDIIKKFKDLDYTVIFVVPRLELIKQSNNEFGDVDIIWSDKTKLTGKKVIIASKDSLRTQCKKLSEIKNIVLIFDECHIGIKQTKALVDAINPVKFIGLTATPERHDGLALLKGYDRKGADKIHKYGCFDDLLQSETVPSLMEKGYLSPLEYYAKAIDGITDIKPVGASDELSGEQMLAIMEENHLNGDMVECYEKYGKNLDGSYRLAIGFAPSIAVAQIMSDTMKQAGHDMPVIHGEMSVKEREDLINKLKNHEIKGLVNASLLTYGFDCPEVSYMFSFRHIKSRPLFFQIIGRGLRTYPGKDTAIFVDHGDSISEFASMNCAVPILDPAINWRVDGFPKQEKQIEKKNRKKVQQMLDTLAEVDPIPCEMVKICSENLMDRCQRAIQNLSKSNLELTKKNEELESDVEDLKSQVENLANCIQSARVVVEESKTKKKELQSEKEELQRLLENKLFEISRLKGEVEMLRKRQQTSSLSTNEHSEVKIVHPEQIKTFKDNSKEITFDFIRKNYCWNRNMIAKKHAPELANIKDNVEKNKKEHELTMEALRTLASYKEVSIDEKTWDSSADYWYERILKTGLAS